MVTQARELLSHDHEAVNVVLKQLLAALDDKDVQESYARLDLLWARLAVHIRAEHLHLFPSIISHLTQAPDDAAPDLSERRSIIESLRADHDFFMRELGRTIAILRELPKNMVRPSDEPDLAAVRDALLEIEKRLATHNEIEENQIYRWSSTILSKPEQLDLIARINAELDNRPPRFSADAWDNR